MAVLLALLAGTVAVWGLRGDLVAQEPPAQSAPLRNYGVVWEQKLSRSGMPSNDSGWRWLRSQGVKSVVTFRPQNDVDYNKFSFERVLRIPLRGDPPTDQQAEEFLRFIQDPANQPVHFHCTAGKSRTGIMAALARYSIDGWPMQKALEEARLYRGGSDLSANRVAWLNNWAAKHKPGSYRIKP
ncbi:MAG: tyrosine-protein phosphatase [Acidobacteria bacterium]|nr:tyrosine-protein phosphatase [Acidobacteriota bacterium]